MLLWLGRWPAAVAPIWTPSLGTFICYREWPLKKKKGKIMNEWMKTPPVFHHPYFAVKLKILVSWCRSPDAFLLPYILEETRSPVCSRFHNLTMSPPPKTTQGIPEWMWMLYINVVIWFQTSVSSLCHSLSFSVLFSESTHFVDIYGSGSLFSCTFVFHYRDMPWSNWKMHLKNFIQI